MIAILYPKADHRAADIAVQVQTLAQPSVIEQIYVVPKHDGRSKAKIQEKLKKASIAILIVNCAEKMTLNQETLNQLKILLNDNKKVCAFIPPGFLLPVENCMLFETAESSLMENLSKIQSQPQTKKVFELLGLILLLSALVSG